MGINEGAVADIKSKISDTEYQEYLKVKKDKELLQSSKSKVDALIEELKQEGVEVTGILPREQLLVHINYFLNNPTAKAIPIQLQVYINKQNNELQE